MGSAAAAVPTLLEMLANGDAAARCGAVEALGNLGPAAAEAIPALIEALEDEDESVVIMAIVWQEVKWHEYLAHHSHHCAGGAGVRWGVGDYQTAEVVVGSASGCGTH